jgi:hypothetical protein
MTIPDLEVEISKVLVEFSQESDNCDSSGAGQELQIWTEDGGAGPFLCISTTRWALDDNCLGQIERFCRKVLKIHKEKVK